MTAPDSPRTIRRLLAANRGEIAIRVFRAATELKIETVGIYTYEDRYSLHRYKCDEAYQIGDKDDPLKPYLDIEEIISLARRKKIDAIHPGYGFLSENKEFVKACEDSGIIFIGPSHEAMAKLGDKVEAKKIARESGVPVIEGAEVDPRNEPEAIQKAQSIGFPIIVKAAAGGGGRGMRVVRGKDELAAALREAETEASRAFGDGTLFLERYIEDPKHIEVQILGDEQGSLIHLYARDCSIQRRFQKVVEVAPAAALSEKVREKLYGYALSIGKKVGYRNAGTVEFLVDREENPFFIEVNPRIQVEHTVTEVVTGIDLVRTQILVAQGLPLRDPAIGIPDQSAVSCSGHAIQCRITTEDPKNDFRPDSGRIIAYRSPGGFGIRLDAGSAYTGAQISPFFDSLLVKITASGRTLEECSSKLERALWEFRVRGVNTNIMFLINVVRHPVFRAGEARVGFLENHPELFQIREGRDRANKILRYIAEVNVNGHPDVKRPDPERVLRSPQVPRWDRRGAYPDGTRQKLQEMGREAFCKWIQDQKGVLVTDTTLRDAHQSLLATRVRTIDMLRAAEGFAKRNPEIFSLEVWGGATFDVSLRFLHECPWERLEKLREAIPNILFQMLLRGSNAVGYTAYPDNVVTAFIETAAEKGIDIFRIFDSQNWLPNMETSIRAVRERTESLAEACICYTGDVADPNEKKFTLEYYCDLAKRLEGSGAHILAIKDMAGLLRPAAARILIEGLKESVSIPIHLHTHDTSSIQAASCLEAVEAGVDIVDAALASMSGLTSQPNLNSLAAMLVRSERDPKLNLDALNDYSNYWEAVRDCYYPFESGLTAGTAEVYEHEIPGGQYSNLWPQARGLGLEDRFDEIKENYKIVNRMLGGIIKVTPSSKVVGDMAMYMTSNRITEEDIFTRGEELSFPESLRGFFKGEIGQPLGGFPEKLQKIVLKGEKPLQGRANDEMEPVDLEAGFTEFQEEYPRCSSFTDYLSYLLYPKVFKAYYAFRSEFGDVSVIPSPTFFFGLPAGDEVRIEIAEGKKLIVEYISESEPDEDGNRTVYFRLNGQSRGVVVPDRAIQRTSVEHRKASGEGEVGSPLQGKLSQLLVQKGDTVSQGTPLFVIEAMKMETTVSAPKDGVVEELVLSEGTLIQADDLVCILK